MDYSHGIGIILSFFLAALPYLLVVKYGRLSNDDIHDDSYYDGVETADRCNMLLLPGSDTTREIAVFR